MSRAVASWESTFSRYTKKGPLGTPVLPPPGDRESIGPIVPANSMPPTSTAFVPTEANSRLPVYHT